MKIIYTFLSSIFILSLLPKNIQMLLIFILLIMLLNLRKKLYVNKQIIPFIIMGFIHFISILINCLTYSHDYSRIFAACNTALIWIIGGLFYSIIEKNEFDFKKINRILYINILILTFLGILMIFIEKIPIINNISIFGRSLMGKDWVNGQKDMRLLAFMEYANLVSMFYFLVFPFAYDYVVQNKNRVFIMIFSLLSFVPVYLSGSRISKLLLIVLLYFILINFLSNSKKKWRILIILSIFIIIFVLLIYGTQIGAKINQLLNSRAGSTTTRLKIYLESINITLKQSPIIGCGIKDYIGDYPLGSHSTYIGFFYKTGFLGLLFAMIGIFGFFKKIIKSNLDYMYKVCFILFLIMCCVEDIDGANWLGILFFIIMGFYIQKIEKGDN